METYKSKRKIAEEERAYKHSRFEWYMTEADAGRLTRELAIAAFRDELTNIVELDEYKKISM